MLCEFLFLSIYVVHVKQASLKMEIIYVLPWDEVPAYAVMLLHSSMYHKICESDHDNERNLEAY